MTDPTPTRAEVDIARFDPCPFGGAMTLDPSGDYVRHDDYAALRERAEAAEAEVQRLKNIRSAIAEGYNAEAVALEKAVSEALASQLTAARRAEAAAWNDAIEAVEAIINDKGYLHTDAIRALRRAAPTEDRCAECDCKNGGTECTWIKSGPVAAPTEGEA